MCGSAGDDPNAIVREEGGRHRPTYPTIKSLDQPGAGAGRMSATTTQQAIYTVQEVARIVRVKPATVYRWISNGEMPHMRCGPGTVRVTGAQLQEYMDR